MLHANLFDFGRSLPAGKHQPAATFVVRELSRIRIDAEASALESVGIYLVADFAWELQDWREILIANSTTPV
jgi:hypothetical protein